MPVYQSGRRRRIHSGSRPGPPSEAETRCTTLQIPPGDEPASTPQRRGFGWVTFVQILLLLVVGGIAGYAALQAHQRAAPSRRGGPTPFRPGHLGRAGRPRLRHARYAAARIGRSSSPSTGTATSGSTQLSGRRPGSRLRNDGDVRRVGRRGGFGRRGFRAGPPAPGLRLAPGDVRSYPGAAVYDLQVLRTVFLHVRDATTGKRSWPRSTAPTSRSPPPSSSTARPIATSACTSAGTRRTGWCRPATSTR